DVFGIAAEEPGGVPVDDGGVGGLVRNSAGEGVGDFFGGEGVAGRAEDAGDLWGFAGEERHEIGDALELVDLINGVILGDIQRGGAIDGRADVGDETLDDASGGGRKVGVFIEGVAEEFETQERGGEGD